MTRRRIPPNLTHITICNPQMQGQLEFKSLFLWATSQMGIVACPFIECCKVTLQHIAVFKFLNMASLLFCEKIQESW